MTDVYAEAGMRFVFACAIQWPGWCRKGRGEEAALAELAACAPRYAPVAELSGVPFDADGAAAAFVVTERVPGTATTDFGALDTAPELDTAPVSAGQLGRLTALVAAAWQVFEQTAADAPATLRKGPRGGGRDRNAIVAHVRETEVLHARMLGLKERPFPPADPAAAAAVRDRILAAITAGAGREPAAAAGRSGRPALFVARRTAWHALDHAWEIGDKLP
ncbi:MAG TPA: hypothetical protein VF162_01015 [Streptosporangiaceae bacterium]